MLAPEDAPRIELDAADGEADQESESKIEEAAEELGAELLSFDRGGCRMARPVC